jgi:hypothetical protein
VRVHVLDGAVSLALFGSLFCSRLAPPLLLEIPSRANRDTAVYHKSPLVQHTPEKAVSRSSSPTYSSYSFHSGSLFHITTRRPSNKRQASETQCRPEAPAAHQQAPDSSHRQTRHEHPTRPGASCRSCLARARTGTRDAGRRLGAA